MAEEKRNTLWFQKYQGNKKNRVDFEDSIEREISYEAEQMPRAEN